MAQIVIGTRAPKSFAASSRFFPFFATVVIVQGIHVIEHTFFLSAGLLYWWHLMSTIRSRARLTGMGPVLYMLSTKLLVGILGIAITFAPDALYAFYKDRAPIWGLSASDDQALAGAIMALEQSIVMGVALAWLFVRALAESESDEQRAERYA